MEQRIDYTARVQYELLRGREATELIRRFPVGYLPIGCLERHGDHLPMGLDIIKAYGVCTIVAQALGGVVFPPHYYAGVHGHSEAQAERFTGEWGNIYTDRTAKESLVDVVAQFARAGIRVLVLYSGHYPVIQIEMMEEVRDCFADHPTMQVIPFCERMVLEGDHAGISETSFMLYLDRSLVNMAGIGEENYRDHGWSEAKAPEKATAGQGEAGVNLVIAHLKAEIDRALAEGREGDTGA